mgnify:CR=1 FL=1
MLYPTYIVIKETITRDHLGSGLIGPLFRGVIVGVYRAANTAIIEIEINNDIENKMVGEWMGSLKIGCVSYIKFIKRGSMYSKNRNAKNIFPPLVRFSLVYLASPVLHLS